MACKFICDGCGKESGGVYSMSGWHKPHDWFERSDEDGVQTACSRECIKTVADKSGKTSTVLPM